MTVDPHNHDASPKAARVGQDSVVVELPTDPPVLTTRAAAALLRILQEAAGKEATE
jgi:hypothetical protein